MARRYYWDEDTGRFVPCCQRRAPADGHRVGSRPMNHYHHDALVGLGARLGLAVPHHGRRGDRPNATEPEPSLTMRGSQRGVPVPAIEGILTSLWSSLILLIPRTAPRASAPKEKGDRRIYWDVWLIGARWPSGRCPSRMTGVNKSTSRSRGRPGSCRSPRSSSAAAPTRQWGVLRPQRLPSHPKLSTIIS